MKKKHLRSLIAVALAVLLLPFGAFGASAADDAGAGGIIDVYDNNRYFQDIYPGLRGRTTVFRSQTREEITYLFNSAPAGNYVVLFGGAWDPRVQSSIGYIDQVAAEYGIPAIYNYDLSLDGTAELNTAANDFIFNYYYTYLVKKYLPQIDTIFADNAEIDGSAGAAVAANSQTANNTNNDGSSRADGARAAIAAVGGSKAKALSTPFLFVYNKNAVTAQQSSYIELGSIASYVSWNGYQPDGSIADADADSYKAAIRAAFETVSCETDGSAYSVVSGAEVLRHLFNRPYYFKGTNTGGSKMTTQTWEAGAYRVIPENDSQVVYEKITYDRYKHLLASEGNYAVLLAAQACHNTFAVLQEVNAHALRYNVRKVYVFDVGLDGQYIGDQVGFSGLTSGDLWIRNSETNTGSNLTEISRRPLAYLYVDLTNKYLTNIVTINDRQTGTVISYTDDSSGETRSAHRTQVPTFYIYNKDYKDATGASAPVPGDVEIMIDLYEIQETYTGGGRTSGGISGKSFYIPYTSQLNDLFARYSALRQSDFALAQREAVTRVKFIPGNAAGASNGKIVGLTPDMEYRTYQDSTWTAVAPGTAEWTVNTQSSNGETADQYYVRYRGREGVSIAGESLTVVVATSNVAAGSVPARTTEADWDALIKRSTADGAALIASFTDENTSSAAIGGANFRQVTDDQLRQLLSADGAYAVLLGSAEDPDAQGALASIGGAASANGIGTIYVWDPAGKDAALLAEFLGYLSNVAEPQSLAAPFLFVYDRDRRDSFGKEAPVIGGVRALAYGDDQAGYQNALNHLFTRFADYANKDGKLLAQPIPPVKLGAVGATNDAAFDGKITNVSPDLEYRRSADSVYSPVPLGQSEITGLGPGLYLVRQSAWEGAIFAGDDTPVTVGSSGEVVAPVTPPPSGNNTGGNTGGTGGDAASGDAGDAGGGDDCEVVISDSKATDGQSAAGDVENGDTATVKTRIESVTDAAGNTTATLSEETAVTLLNNVKEQETAGRQAVIEIVIDTSLFAGSAKVNIAGGILKRFADDSDAVLRLSMGIADLSFSAAAVDRIAGQAGDAVVSFTAAKSESPAVAGLQNRPAYAISADIGGTAVSGAVSWPVDVSIPYALGSGEDRNAVVIYRIDGDGTPELLPAGRYVSADSAVRFTADGFTKYVIGYNKVSFGDVSTGDWFGAPVTFLAARGITEGVDAEHFGPGLTVTREQFIVILLRARGIKPDGDLSDSFSDVGENYAAPYIAHAKKLGITAGVGDNRFSPKSEISRQDLFVLLYNALYASEAPESADLSDFGDSGELREYARTAAAELVGRGLVKGDGTSLRPGGSSTRAELAQLIYGTFTL